MVNRCQTWPTWITFVLNTTVNRRQTWAAPIVRVLHTSVIQHWTWPFSVVHKVHTYVCWRQTWPVVIILSLLTSFCRWKTWSGCITYRLYTLCQLTLNMPTHIVRGLHFLVEQFHMRWHWSMYSREHVDVHAIQIIRVKCPYDITIYSSIFHHLY